MKTIPIAYVAATDNAGVAIAPTAVPTNGTLLMKLDMPAGVDIQITGAARRNTSHLPARGFAGKALSVGDGWSQV